MKPRSRYSRSTNGCHTCRLRHLKCDEGFPCQRCVSAGWQCDRPIPTTAVIFQHERPRDARQLQAKLCAQVTPYVWLKSPSEWRAFEFYIRKAGPLLSGVLDWEFWSWLVPHAAETDLVVRYMLLAISQLCEHPVRKYENGHLDIHPLDRRHLIAVQWHAQALAHGRSCEGQVELPSLILRYALLLSHEFQQDNFRHGWRLSQITYSLLSPLITSGCEHRDHDTTSGNEILKALVPVFTRNICLLFDSWTETTDDVDAEADLETVERSIFHTLCIVFASIKDAYLTSHADGSIDHEKLVAKHHDLYSILLNLQAHASTAPLSDHQAQPIRRQALQEYCHIGCTWLKSLPILLATSLSNAEFLHAVLEQTKVFQANAPTLYPAASRTTFFHSIAIRPTAYLVTVFTNDIQLREGALALMTERKDQSCGSSLLTIVTRTKWSSDRQASQTPVNKKFQIYHGHKDQELLVHDVDNTSMILS